LVGVALGRLERLGADLRGGLGARLAALAVALDARLGDRLVPGVLVALEVHLELRGALLREDDGGVLLALPLDHDLVADRVRPLARDEREGEGGREERAPQEVAEPAGRHARRLPLPACGVKAGNISSAMTPTCPTCGFSHVPSQAGR